MSKQEGLQRAVDEIREKLDFTAIQKASTSSAGTRVLERYKMIGGHAEAGGVRAYDSGPFIQ
ncbi:hypothetical protein [Lactococcus garvieae]|uniref:hypothetical protein n=1 Tax=Lactococcus garvieae TaxID=1363 RepID=UPI00254AD5AF|nr:hypothetical protein [Lactococcus garvieae]